MRGIILAGGYGTRLYPLTEVTSKHLLPVYDKPLIYYPLSVLMLAGITDILIISTPAHMHQYEQVLGDGKKLGIKLHYMKQEKPEGIAQAFLLAESFIGSEGVALILGDNIFYGQGLPRMIKQAINDHQGATLFCYEVNDPARFGVLTFSNDGSVQAIDEKPAHPNSNWAVTGLYIYDADVVQIAKTLTPSARGELEITDINNAYLRDGRLRVVKIGRGSAWFDTGTPQSMLSAAVFMEMIEQRQCVKVGCIEEVAFRMGYISKAELLKLAEPLKDRVYGQYLLRVATEEA
ncbi:glucose-1-phosphate thymidylyltransferase RfbA [Bacillus sp. FSL W7-1360]